MPTVKETLDQSPELAHLMRQSRSRNRLRTQLSSVLPSALSALLQFRDEGGVLTIIAPNNAQAAKLRQRLVSMTDCLRSQGHRLDRIRITVSRSIAKNHAHADEADDTATTQLIDRPKLSRRTIDRIAQCSKHLSDQPNLARILARIARKMTSR